MAEGTELELLITVVVGADDERSARTACRDLVRRIGGRIVESGDCSDEEPGCWSVTISRDHERGHSTGTVGTAALSRAVRSLLRELGPSYVRHRVACEPPTAWTVVDNPALVDDLVPGGERMLVEAWQGGSFLPTGFDLDGFLIGSDDPDEPHPQPEPTLGDLDENGAPRPRLYLVVDVVTERRAGAEWPARAVASRLSRTVRIVDCAERPPAVRMSMDLGPVQGDPREIVQEAIAGLGGGGWSRIRSEGSRTVARWSAAPTPPSGVAAIELWVSSPDPVAPEPDAPNAE